MSDLAFARALHVLAVVFWIGGVAMVTTVLLPATRRLKTSQEQQGIVNLTLQMDKCPSLNRRIPQSHLSIEGG